MNMPTKEAVLVLRRPVPTEEQNRLLEKAFKNFGADARRRHRRKMLIDIGITAALLCGLLGVIAAIAYSLW
jgi:hypothetical protein